ncbi:hypothetical protein LDENG_00113560 [Lucifuga dentata]|nr:hypothetical protein LDENG_00113560 [Lucifuga dentata]
MNTSPVMEEFSVSHQTDKKLSSSEPPAHHPSSPSTGVVIVKRQKSSTTVLLPAVSPPSDQVYLQAAAIFQQLYTEKPVTQQLLHYGEKTDATLPESRDKTMQTQAYQLAFNTLKYQDLLEDVMIDSCFHISQHIADDLLPLAMVMLFDFQDRRFLLREHPAKEGEELQQEVRDLESGLYRCKTKLAASLARCRVKQNLRSISCFLSDSVRTKQHRAKILPLYAWVNVLKNSVEEVCEALQNEGLCEVKNMTHLGKVAFCRDPLCPDTLMFSSQLRAWLQHSSLTSTHTLSIQDRSVCVAVSALRPLLSENADVLLVGSFSAVTVAHVAVLAAAHSGRVLVCGADQTPPQREEIKELLTQMDIKNVRVLSGPFSGLDEWNPNVQRLRVVIVMPQCSSTAVNDPVLTILSEHGDWELLRDLSHGCVSQRKIHTMTAQQERLLTHALTFSKVQSVVYCTRSAYPEENEQLVQRVLQKAHTHSKVLSFRVSRPVFSEDSGPEGMTGKFFRLEPSQYTNGCFIAQLVREVESVQDVLARAAAKGLLIGLIPNQSKTSKKGRNRKNDSARATSKIIFPLGQDRPAQSERENVTPTDHTKTIKQKLLSPIFCDPHNTSKMMQKEPERDKKMKPGSLFKASGKEVRTQEVAKAADLVLPPISSPTPSSLSVRSISSLSRPSLRASPVQLIHTSSSSSSVSVSSVEDQPH